MPRNYEGWQGDTIVFSCTSRYCDTAKTKTSRCETLAHPLCRNPSLGLATKTKACKVAGQMGGPRVISHALGSAKSVREWTLTLPSELPLWELEFEIDFWIFKARLQGSKPIGLKIFFYIIENILKFKCIKWAPMTHMDIWSTSYDQKKGWESNWQFDSWALKVKDWHDFLASRWCVTYHWKALDEGCKFSWSFIAIRGVNTKLWAPKVTRVPIVRIPRLSLRSPKTKCCLDVTPVEKCREYYKGEGGGFPQVRGVVSLVSLRLPVARPNTKSAQTMH